MSSNAVSLLSTARRITFCETTFSALFDGLRSEAFFTATTILFSLIVISLSASLISLTEPLFYYKFSALALSTGLMTILTVTPMYDRTHAVVVCITKKPFLSPLHLGLLLICSAKGPFFRISFSKFHGCVRFFTSPDSVC